jgi:pyridoxal kinase
MSRILAISSQVASGHVGLSAIVPALNRLGHEVVALPTIVLSNHPGHPHCAGLRIDPAELAKMRDALAANGRLQGIDVILSGYLPSSGHVDFVRDTVGAVRRHSPAARFICDPVLGDDPKGLYIAEHAALAVRDQLLPIADLIVPNRFELEWLSGQSVRSVADALAAARSLPPPETVATSISESSGSQVPTLANVRITSNHATLCRSPMMPNVPHGTGDLFAGLLAADPDLGLASARLSHVITMSLGNPELALIEACRTIETSVPRHEEPVTEDGDPVTTWVAGADGCPGGWVVVLHPLGQPAQARIELCRTFSDVLDLTPQPQYIAVDMPIGLPERATRGGRRADVEARAVLGERRSSVFPVPARATIACADYRGACDIALAHSDPPRKISRQAFNLFPKIREIDNLMSPELQRRVFEVHPEAAFWALNGESALELPKKVKSRPSTDGIELRKKLLSAAGYDISRIEATDDTRAFAGMDDILDAFAAAWSASRIARGQARRFPADPDADAKGLRMEIWC